MTTVSQQEPKNPLQRLVAETQLETSPIPNPLLIGLRVWHCRMNPGNGFRLGAGSGSGSGSRSRFGHESGSYLKLSGCSSPGVMQNGTLPF